MERETRGYQLSLAGKRTDYPLKLVFLINHDWGRISRESLDRLHRQYLERELTERNNEIEI